MDNKSTKKMADKFFSKYRFDLICVIAAFNKPSKCSVISREIAGFHKNCLITLIDQKVLQECDVYLYLKDPFLTIDKFRIALK